MLAAITGGIGSGKSVVSQLLRVMGFSVYDCDARAKWVMTHDPELRQQLIELFGPQTYVEVEGSETLPILNKPYLSSQIFGNPDALARMNACVHPAVARDLQRQYTDYLSNPSNLSNPSTISIPSNLSNPSNISNPSNPSHPTPLFFFESAILFESGFDRLSHPDLVWTVSAPLELRIARASMRDHATREQILNRIQSQLAQEEKEKRSDAVIYNDPEHSVIEQVNGLLNS